MIKSVKDVNLPDFVNSIVVMHVNLFNHSKVRIFEQELQILQFYLLFRLIFIKLKLLDLRYIASAHFFDAWCPVLVHSQYFQPWHACLYQRLETPDIVGVYLQDI